MKKSITIFAGAFWFWLVISDQYGIGMTGQGRNQIWLWFEQAPSNWVQGYWAPRYWVASGDWAYREAMKCPEGNKI